jgi:Transposase DDE domain
VKQVERENVIREPAQTADPSPSEAEAEPTLRRTYRNSPPMKISTTDPEVALSSKRGVSEFAYYDNYLIDSRSCIITGVMATPARLPQEIVAARQTLERTNERFGLQPVSVTADKSYGTGEFLSWLSNRQATPCIPVLDRRQQTKGFYTQHEFDHVPEENAYRCPGGHLLRYMGLSRGAQGFTYGAKPAQCRPSEKTTASMHLRSPICCRANLFPECYVMPAEYADLRRQLRYRALVVHTQVQFKNKTAGLLIENGIVYETNRLHQKKYFAELLKTSPQIPEELKRLLGFNRMQIELYSTLIAVSASILQRDPLLAARITRLQYRTLLQAGGFELTQVIPMPAGSSIVGRVVVIP